jgi:chromosome partitioning protein
LTSMVSIVVANQKGGVGKTTLAFHLARYCSESSRTLALDLDPQGNLTSRLTADLPSMSNVRAAFESQPIEPMKVSNTLDLIGADLTLSIHEAKQGFETMFVARELLSSLSYDVVIVDSPPNLGAFLTNALIAGRYVVVPIVADDFNPQALAGLFQRVQVIRDKANPGLQVGGIVISNARENTNYTRDFITRLRGQYDAAIFSTVLPSSVKVLEAVANKVPVWEYAPSSKPAEAYRQLCKEVSALWMTT